jgi:hypothetical protein
MSGTTTLWEILFPSQDNTTYVPPPVDFGPRPSTGDEFNPAGIVFLAVIALAIALIFIYKRLKTYDPEDRIHKHDRFVQKAKGFNLAGYFIFTIMTGTLFIVDIFYFTIAFKDEPLFAITGMLGVGAGIGWGRVQLRDWYRERQRGIIIKGPLRTPEGRKDGVTLRNVEMREAYTLSQKQKTHLLSLGVPQTLINNIHAYPSIIAEQEMALFVFDCEKEKALKMTMEPDIDAFGTVYRPTAYLDMVTQDTINITVDNKLIEGDVHSKEVVVIRALYDDEKARRDIEGLEKAVAPTQDGTDIAKFRAEHNEGRATAAAVSSHRHAFLEEHQKNEDTGLITDAIGMAKADHRYRNKQELTLLQKIQGSVSAPTAIVVLACLFGIMLGVFIGVAYANSYWASLVGGIGGAGLVLTKRFSWSQSFSYDIEEAEA